MNEQIEKALKILPNKWEHEVRKRLEKRGIIIAGHFIVKVVKDGYNHTKKLEVLEVFAELTKEVVGKEKEITEDLTATLAEV